MPEYTEQDIIEGCRRNDRLLQEHLYKKYYSLFLKLCARYAKDLYDAEQLLQDGFLKIFNHIKDYAGSGSFEGWMRRVIVNTCLDYLKSKYLKNAMQLHFPNEMNESPKFVTDNTALDKIAMKDLLGIIQKLPPMSRTVFNLFVFDGYSHKEIGKLLDMSEGTSQWHVNNARKNLQQIITANQKKKISIMSKNEFDALLLKKLEEEAFEYKPDSWNQLSEKLNIALPVHEEVPSFDALLVAKLAENNFDYSPESWNRLAEKLDNKVPENEPVTVPFSFRKWGIAIGTAAALLIIGFAAIKFNDSDKITENNNSPAIVKNTATKQQTQIPEISEKQAEPAPTASATNIAPFQPVAHQSGQANNNPILPAVINNPPVILVPNHNEPLIAAPENKTEASQNPDAPEIVKTQKNETNIFNKGMTAPVKQEGGSDYIAQNQPNGPWFTSDYVTSAPAKPKTNISFGGGVNYGNINTGYTAGISIKRKIGGDFFVDGTVAMMYNNNANNVAANNGPPVSQPSNTASKPSSGAPANSISTPALDPVQKLYYVQMNPSFGYQIEDKVALSVGGDFQKMLNEKTEIVQPDNNNTKVFPTMDIGLTTKTEFTISPNLQAGLVYREGLNNLFKSDAPYVNRRYIQVQFKYNIPLK